MLRKPFKKALAMLLCVAVLQGGFPGYHAGGSAYAAAQPVSLANSDFETVPGVPGWTVEDGSGTVALSSAVTHSGLGSLEMIDTGSSQSPLVRSEMIPVKAGDTFSASAYVNVASNGGAAYVDAIFSVWYCDAGGNRIGQAYGPDITANGGWNQYSSSTITVPAQAGDDNANVAGICVALYGGGSTECKAYFDDIAVTVNSSAAALNNGDFETAPSVPGWTVEDGSGTVALSGTTVHGGAFSMEMVDTGAAQSPLVKSEMIPVKAGDTFSASAYVNVASNGGGAYVDAIFSVWYCDADGNRIGQAYGPDITANSGWNQYSTSTITVPAQAGGDNANVAGICVAFYGGGSTECKAYFDDVQVFVESSAPPEDTTKLSNPDFEFPAAPDGSIPGWQMDDGATNENFMITAAESYNHTHSLQMADPGEGSSPWLYSSKVDANPGDKATLTAHVKVEAGGYAELSILYLNSAGEQVAPYENIEIGACGWSEQTVTGTVPNGASAVKAFIWSGNSAKTTAFFDDLSLTSGPELLPKTIFSSDCSNLLSMKSAGWFIDDPYQNVYTTDSTHSTGSVTPQKDVPAGQMLFYMSGSADADAVGCFKKVDAVNTIGDAPWELSLDMNLQALMTSSAPDAASGFSIVIDVGKSDQVYRVNFGGDGKIRALTDSGVKTVDAALPVGDGKVHHWLMQGDKTGSLLIKCDGAAVASFTGVHAAGSWGEPGVHFIAYNNNISSGNTEIYLDSMKLTVYTQNPGAGVTAGTPVDLGAPVMGGKPLFLNSIIEKNPVTNRDELYTVTTGSEDNSSVFYAIDPTTGEMLFSEQIQGTVHNYGLVKGSDGKIYFAGVDTGKLYRYTPAAKGQGKVDELGVNPCSTWVWDLAASDDGKIYGATSETDGGTTGAAIFEYDIAAAAFKDLGVVKAGATYARGLGVSGDSLYVGVGMPDALFKINRTDTAQKTEISIPAFGNIPGTGTDGRICGHVWAYNGKLIIRDNAMKFFVLDENTHELLNVLSCQQAISSPSPYNGSIIYYKAQNAVWQYDCSTNTAKKVDNSPVLSNDASNALSWFTPAEGPKAGRQLLAITDDAGGFVVYDPQDNTAAEGTLSMRPQAVDIQSLEKGPDGKIYTGGYQFGASVFDPASKTVIYNAPRLDQPEGIGFLNGKVYFGTYGSARIFGYDPSKPFSYADSASGNPGLAYDIGNDQDRPFALTSGDNKLFVGSVPDYGMLGGALTVYDEQAGTWTEHRNVVQDQSITGLAYKDGKIYGGTSVAGGLGIASTAEQAKVFVWDVAKGEKVKEATISIPGLSSVYEGKTRTTPVMIGSLSFGKDGLLWGAVDGALVALNPDTLEVVKYKILTSMNYDSDSAWRPFYLRWGADDLLYTTIGRKVTAFNTQTMGYDTLTGYAGLATLGNDGNIYYANGSRLMMVPLTRQGDSAAYAAGTAVNAAKDAIDMLPGSYNITIANQSAVEAARELVNKALAAGAAGTDISNLSKLAACEAAVQNAKTYSISVNPQNCDFGTLTEGDSSLPAPETATVTNTGNQSITVAQPSASFFTIAGSFPITLLPGETGSFTIQPKAGLSAGSYKEDISISGNGGAGCVLHASVTVAKNEFEERTLSDESTGILISGDSIQKDSRLTVSSISLHETGTCAACDAIRSHMADGAYTLVLGKNISLSYGFKGSVTLTIPVEGVSDGQTVTALHCKDSTLEEITCIVKDGKVSFTTTSLSPIALFTGTKENTLSSSSPAESETAGTSTEPQATAGTPAATGTPATGDGGTSSLTVLLAGIMALAVSTLLLGAASGKKKQKK